MKKKGIIVAAFFGFILLTSTVMISLPGLMNPIDTETTITGTPADNFPDEQRAQFCGSGIARSTNYVTEYSIPTVCTNPLAIVTDFEGNVWFAQTNTGNLAKFDPVTETFSEYENPSWPPNGRSMMWGMDAAPDGSIWYTDETFDSIWKFTPN
ncbi:MAG: lyase, partial [Candidatus Nitrosomaritimum yanchengensis]